MTFQIKRRIDYWAGGLLLALLFVPVRILGVTMRRNHTTTHRHGCAVIKLVGAGSLFLAMPSMLEIRQRFPNGRFFLVGTPAVLKVAREFDWFDEYWVIDDSSVGRLIVSVVRVLWLMGSRADHLIDLEVHSRFTTLLTVLSTVRNRIGFVDEIVFWRRGFYTHMTFFNVHGPVYVFYDLLARWFGVDTVSVSEFYEAFRAQVIGMKLPPRTRPASPYVAVGHGCSELGRERRLRPDEWQSMLRSMILAGHEILLLGGPEDSAAADTIIEAVGTGRNLCGQLNIAQSARLIEGAAAFYGIDSMLLHFARALAVPSVSVFGPTDPATRLRPLGARERVAFARLPCSPCIHVNEKPPCQGKWTCMALALQELVASPDREPTVALRPASPPPVGWEVDPSASRVREVSVTSF
jgi:ADP-heptose:LPS heptosyltransferase